MAQQAVVEKIPFEERIRINRRNSAILVFVFLVFLSALGGFLGYLLTGNEAGTVVGGLMLLLLSLLWFVIAYYSGGNIVLSISGAMRVDKSFNPRLYNVVEEMSIAAGLPMPQIYVIRTNALNAFATGRDPYHASVAVTTGLLEKLSRDELQGVIAHEISHIRNYDIRLMMLMAVLVGVVIIVSDLMLRLIRYVGPSLGRGRGKGGGAFAIFIIIIGAVLAIVAPFIAYIIQFATSRQREYLADASGAELTRYPEGLASALEKIAYENMPMKQASKATQHLFIVNPFMRLGGRSLFSTHPPIEERIRRLRSM
jgi:heat shock protein HtpX